MVSSLPRGHRPRSRGVPTHCCAQFVTLFINCNDGERRDVAVTLAYRAVIE